MKTPDKIKLMALLIGFELALSAGAQAGSCCGGGGAATLIIPKGARAAASFSAAGEYYNGYFDQGGDWHPDPPGSELAQYRTSLALAVRLAGHWQGSVNLPYIWNKNHYSSVDSSTRGMGDTSLGISYEAFDAPTCVTRIRSLRDLTPSIYINGGLLIPTGISPYDEVDNSFDITGRGFYKADLSVLIEKGVFPWTFSLAGGIGHHFKRKINREYGSYVAPYEKQLGDTANAAISLGYTVDLPWEITNGMSLITTATFGESWEGKGEVDGVEDTSSGLKKRIMGISATLLSFGNDWSTNLGFTTSRPEDGWGRNSPATNIFTLGVRHVYY